MPTPHGDSAEKKLQEIVDAVGLYPMDAYIFVQQGLSYTVEKIHGSAGRKREEITHVSGQQLCDGLREYALSKWGMLSRTVLERWNISGTFDFGRIVFAMVDHGFMRK